MHSDVQEYATTFGPIPKEVVREILVVAEFVTPVAMVVGLTVAYLKSDADFPFTQSGLNPLGRMGPIAIIAGLGWFFLLPFSRTVVFTLYSALVSILGCWLSGAMTTIKSRILYHVYRRTALLLEHGTTSTDRGSVFLELTERDESYTVLLGILCFGCLISTSVLGALYVEVQVVVSALITLDLFLCTNMLQQIVSPHAIKWFFNPVATFGFLLGALLFLPQLVPFWEAIGLGAYGTGVLMALRKSSYTA